MTLVERPDSTLKSAEPLHEVSASAEVAVILEVGSRDLADECHYPDVDLHCPPGRYDAAVFTRKDGTPLD